MENYLEVIKTEIAKLNLNDVAIAEIAKEYLALKVEGIEDKKGLQAVHNARMYVKGKRVEIEKKRKELKADSIAFGKAVDAEAERLTEQLKPIEAHLQAEEAKVEAEKQRIKEEAEKAEAERVQSRVMVLLALGANYDTFSSLYILGETTCTAITLKTASDNGFQEIVSLFTFEATRIAEAAKIEAELAEKERIEREKAEILEEQARQEQIAEENKKMQLERDRLADQERQRLVEEAKLKEERNKIEAERIAFEQEKARDLAEKKRLEDIELNKLRAEEKAKREEELKSDKEKILGFLKTILDTKFSATLTNEESQIFVSQMTVSLQNWVKIQEEGIENL